MNTRGGIFGFPIMIIFLVMVIWIWAIIVPIAINPSIDETITDTAAAEHGDGIEFFLRMIPWMVPLLLVIGLLWLGVVSG